MWYWFFPIKVIVLYIFSKKALFLSAFLHSTHNQSQQFDRYSVIFAI